MRALKYLDQLMLTHQRERTLKNDDGADKWPEPQWTAYWCLMIALRNYITEKDGDPDMFWKLVESARKEPPCPQSSSDSSLTSSGL